MPVNISDTLIAQGNNRTSSQGLTHLNGLGGSQITYENTLAAGASYPVPATGNTFYIFASNGTISIKPNNGFFVDYVQGTGLLQKGGNAFNQLQITNSTASAVTFVLIVGFDEFIDKRVILVNGPLTAAIPVQNALTKAIGSGLFAIPATTIIPFPGNANGSTARKAFVVANTDVANAIYVLDAANVVCGIVFPSSSWSIECAGELGVYNPNGGTINNVAVTEIYYAA